MRPSSSAFLAAAALALAVTATSAAADETWTSNMGQIAYFDEQGGDAIFTFVNVDAYPAYLIIPGLAGNFDNRGTHDAYWISDSGGGSCASRMAYGDLAESTDWGRAIVAFDQASYPSSFTLLVGYCFNAPSIAIRAETDAR